MAPSAVPGQAPSEYNSSVTLRVHFGRPVAGCCHCHTHIWHKVVTTNCVQSHRHLVEWTYGSHVTVSKINTTHQRRWRSWSRARAGGWHTRMESPPPKFFLRVWSPQPSKPSAIGHQKPSGACPQSPHLLDVATRFRMRTIASSERRGAAAATQWASPATANQARAWRHRHAAALPDGDAAALTRPPRPCLITTRRPPDPRAGHQQA